MSEFKFQLKIDLTQFAEGLKSAQKMAVSGIKNIEEILKGIKTDVDVSDIDEELKKLNDLINDIDDIEIKADSSDVKNTANDVEDTEENLRKKVEEPFSFKGNASDLLSEFAKIGLAIDGVKKVAGMIESVAEPFAKYESGLKNLNTLINVSEGELAQYGEQIKELGKITGDIEQVNNGAWLAVSKLGKQVLDNSEFMESMAKASVAGKASIEESISLTANIIKSMGLEVSDSEKIMNQAFQTVKYGDTNFRDLANSLGGVSPIANAAGVSLSELNAVYATATGVTGDTSVVTTQLKAALSNIIKPSESAKQTAQELGLEFSASAIQAQGFSGFLQQLQEKTGGNIETLGKLFESTEAINIITALTSSQYETFNEKMRLIEDSSGAMTEAFEEQTDSLEYKQKKLKASLEALAISLIEKLAPVITGIVEGMTEFTEIVDRNKGLFALLAVTIATYTITTKLAMMATASTTAGMTAQGIALAGLRAAWLKLNTVMSANPVMAVVTAGIIAATVAISAWQKHLDKESEKQQNIIETSNMIKNERTEFETLVATLKTLSSQTVKTEKDTENYKKTVNELNEKYGDYVGLLDDSIDKYETIKTKLDDIRQKMIDEAITRMVAAKRDDLVNEVAEAELSKMELIREQSEMNAKFDMLEAERQERINKTNEKWAKIWADNPGNKNVALIQQANKEMEIASAYGLRQQLLETKLIVIRGELEKKTSEVITKQAELNKYSESYSDVFQEIGKKKINPKIEPEISKDTSYEKWLEDIKKKQDEVFSAGASYLKTEVGIEVESASLEQLQTLLNNVSDENAKVLIQFEIDKRNGDIESELDKQRQAVASYIEDVKGMDEEGYQFKQQLIVNAVEQTKLSEDEKKALIEQNLNELEQLENAKIAKKLSDEASYYESVKFQDENYLNWKTQKIDEEVDKMAISEDKKQTIKAQKLGAMQMDYASYLANEILSKESNNAKIEQFDDQYFENLKNRYSNEINAMDLTDEEKLLKKQQFFDKVDEMAENSKQNQIGKYDELAGYSQAMLDGMTSAMDEYLFNENMRKASEIELDMQLNEMNHQEKLRQIDEEISKAKKGSAEEKKLQLEKQKLENQYASQKKKLNKELEMSEMSLAERAKEIMKAGIKEAIMMLAKEAMAHAFNGVLKTVPGLPGLILAPIAAAAAYAGVSAFASGFESGTSGRGIEERDLITQEQLRNNPNIVIPANEDGIIAVQKNEKIVSNKRDISNDYIVDAINDGVSHQELIKMLVPSGFSVGTPVSDWMNATPPTPLTLRGANDGQTLAILGEMNENIKKATNGIVAFGDVLKEKEFSATIEIDGEKVAETVTEYQEKENNRVIG